MGVREQMKARREMPAVVAREVPGLGTVHVKRVSAVEATRFEDGFEAVAATILDEENRPLYEKAADARKDDWAIVRPLLDAFNAVNTIDGKDVEDAGKN
jgi:hypothetical protein